METTTLKEHIAGEVVLPEDSTYESLRNVLAHTGKPAVIIRCRNKEDVQEAVQFGRDNRLLISIRCGGHSGAGFSTNENGLVIDLSLMNATTVIDEEKHIVRIEGGAKWVEVAHALTPHGLAISSGDTKSVGVGGLMLTGGMGWMVRKYGLALDNVVAAEVVTANGDVLRASSDEHADLFWAIRGGGGNFGVITAFEVTAHPVKHVFFGAITYPVAETAAVLKGWRDYMRAASEDITTIVNIFPAFGDTQPPLSITACYAGADADAANKAIDPLLHLGTVLNQTVKEMPYEDVLEEITPPPFVPLVKNSFASDCSDELLDSIVTDGSKVGPMIVQIRSLGGTMARVPRDATAFAHRDSEVMVLTVLLDTKPEAVSKFNDFRQLLAPFVAGAYGNFLSTRDKEDVTAIYPPETLARLSTIKRTYDPENVFNQNYNIEP